MKFLPKPTTVHLNEKILHIFPNIYRLSSCNAASVLESNYQKRLKVEENARCENPAKQEIRIVNDGLKRLFCSFT